MNSFNLTVKQSYDGPVTHFLGTTVEWLQIVCLHEQGELITDTTA